MAEEARSALARKTETFEKEETSASLQYSHPLAASTRQVKCPLLVISPWWKATAFSKKIRLKMG